MSPLHELYLLEVERARDRAKPAHDYDTHCLCYGCEDTRADRAERLVSKYYDRRCDDAALEQAGVWPHDCED